MRSLEPLHPTASHEMKEDGSHISRRTAGRHLATRSYGLRNQTRTACFSGHDRGHGHGHDDRDHGGDDHDNGHHDNGHRVRGGNDARRAPRHLPSRPGHVDDRRSNRRHSIVPRQEPRRGQLRRGWLSRQQQKRACYCIWLFPPKSTAATSLLKHRSQQFSVGRLCRTMCGCHIVALCRPSGWARVLQRVVQLRRSPAIPYAATGLRGEGGIRTHGTVTCTTVFEF